MSTSCVDCIYCGQYQVASREHVLQDALGGVNVLTNVCAACNKTLSAVDRVLVVESGLAILVRRELGGVGPNSWDVDDARDGMLLEARTTPGADNMTLVPQLIFDRGEQLIYCDGDDVTELGPDEAMRRFQARLRAAYRHLQINGPTARKRDHKGKDMLKFRPVDRVRSFYRFPPRICCQEPLTRFGRGAIMFSLRYLTEMDRDRALDRLSDFDWRVRNTKSRIQLGSASGEVRITFCLTTALRALTKIGFNLLAFFCRSTPVNRNTFPRTVAWIADGEHLQEFGDIEKFGFVAPSDVSDLNCPPKSHSFRLTHNALQKTWKMYAAFFGGQAAAYVEFPGPNNESWVTMDVTAPYDRPMLKPLFDNWYRAIDARAVLDMRRLFPTLPWGIGGETRIRREPIPT